MPEGRLVLVATPIGNLGDLSPRAVDALRDADVIAAEDTRRTRTLLSHAGVSARGRLISVREHNERQRAVELVDEIRADLRMLREQERLARLAPLPDRHTVRCRGVLAPSAT